MSDARSNRHTKQSMEAGPWRFRATTVEGVFSPWSILSSVDPAQHIVVWRAPGEAVTLGIGTAQEARFSTRTNSLKRAFEERGDAHRSAFVDTPLRAFCSVAFDPDVPFADEWAGFDAIEWVIPQITLTVKASKVEVLLFGRREEFGELEDRAEALLRSGRGDRPAPRPRNVEVQVNDQHYMESVEKALQAISSEKATKVVVAQRGHVTAKEPIDPVSMLITLNARFPRCFLFAKRGRTRGGSAPVFLGATPERLVRIQQDELLTEALAGSAPRGVTEEADAHHRESLLQDPKERREHDLVVRMIEEELEPLVEKLKRSGQPEVRALSNVQHLCTPIRGELKPGVGILDAIEKLHPTPAVCGTPRAEALALLRQIEPFQRGLYAGVFGPIDLAGVSGEVAVTIRSALIDGASATLYAGAGIVDGSVPEREAHETRMKFSAILESFS